MYDCLLKKYQKYVFKFIPPISFDISSWLSEFEITTSLKVSLKKRPWKPVTWPVAVGHFETSIKMNKVF
jgi:hypothetical protein